MAPKCGTFNFNTNNLQYLMQNGLNMLGGQNMFGQNGMNVNFGNNNFFTNCYGEPNYDAMAGYAVVNSVFGVLGQAAAYYQAEQTPQINYEQENHKIQQQILEKENELLKLISSGASEDDINKLKSVINDLEVKQQSYQQNIDLKTINKFKSVSWRRADIESVDAWLNGQNTNPQATKKEMNRASYEYRHAETPEDRKKYAQALIKMYESNRTELQKYKPLYYAVKREENLQ